MIAATSVSPSAAARRWEQVGPPSTGDPALPTWAAPAPPAEPSAPPWARRRPWASAVPGGAPAPERRGGGGGGRGATRGGGGVGGAERRTEERAESAQPWARAGLEARAAPPDAAALERRVPPGVRDYRGAPSRSACRERCPRGGTRPA